MRKHRLWLILIGILVVIGVMLAVFVPSREPVYAGKRLSEYVRMIGEATSGGMLGRMGVDSPSAEAIRQIGTNALPYLLKWIRYNAPVWKRELYSAVNSVGEKLTSRWEFTDQQTDRAEGAVQAFSILGADAAGAIPELSRILNGSDATATEERAVRALGYLGRDALPPLLAILTNQHAATLRSTAARSIEQMGTNARPAVPALLRCLEDEQDDIVALAAVTLEWFVEPAVIVSALVKSLDDNRPGIRSFAVSYLAHFGSKARPAVPALLRLLKDPDWRIRVEATNTLQHVDRQVLENANAR